MAKEKKKTPLHKDSPFIELGILYHEDIPKYHINGIACSKEEWQENVAYAESVKNEYMKSPILKKEAKKRLLTKQNKKS